MKKIAILLLLAMLGGCSYFQDKDSPENWTAERLYAEAKRNLDSGNYVRAVELYERLEALFPFGVYGQQAMLDLSYTYYKSSDYDGAVSTADRFIKLYPQNRYVDYAYYLKGLADFTRGKGWRERFLPIDESRRDTSGALQAFRDFSELVNVFPDSRYAEDAKLRMLHLRNVLAKTEIHVARYYIRLNAYVAAANRARFVVEQYPRTTSVPDALVILAKSYKIMQLDNLSADTLRVLELNYPNHPGLEEVRDIKIN